MPLDSLSAWHAAWCSSVPCVLTHLILPTTSRVGAVIILILQLGELRQRQVKVLLQGPTAGKDGGRT
jgi:hypothetical protein